MTDPIKSSGRQNQRRQVYINGPFQSRFIIQFCSLIVLGGALFSLFVYYYSRPSLTTAFVDSRLRVMSTADYLLPALGLIALFVTAIITFLAAMRLLIFSHKIAGPLYRLEKTAQAVGEGNLNQKIRLRAQDQLQDLAQSMDVMVADLRMRLQIIKRETERLKQLRTEVQRSRSAPDEILKQLGEIQSNLDEQVNHFQV